MTIALYVLIFFVGLICGYVLRILTVRLKSYSGVIRVIRKDDGLLYSLELNEDPADLEYKSEVIFKVETSD